MISLRSKFRVIAFCLSLVTALNLPFSSKSQIFTFKARLGDINSSQNQTLEFEQLPLMPLCTSEPNLVNKLIETGLKLGVQMKIGIPELPGKDATYKAIYGDLGLIVIKDRSMSSVVRCQLITHEFIHVLQHLKGSLESVEPLGWTIDLDLVKRYGSLQEVEAYTHQDKVGLVLFHLQNLSN